MEGWGWRAEPARFQMKEFKVKMRHQGGEGMGELGARGIANLLAREWALSGGCGSSGGSWPAEGLRPCEICNG